MRNYTDTEKSEAPVLSRRLTAIKEYVTPGYVLADIGTDHALLPVRLLMEGKIPRAICCDIGRGPLERAREHLELYHVDHLAETRLSDGLSALEPGEADSVLIAGMGGELTVRILKDCDRRTDEAGRGFLGTVREWILSPHTEWDVVRRYLRVSGRVITRERMLREDGKYYVVILAVPGDGEIPYREAEKRGLDREAAECYGPLLCFEKDEILREYLLDAMEKNRQIRKRLAGADREEGGSSTARERRSAELEREKERITTALHILNSQVPDCGVRPQT